MGTKKLEIGSCQWLLENENEPGVRQVWGAQLQECKRKRDEREARRKRDRLNARLSDDRPPAERARM